MAAMDRHTKVMQESSRKINLSAANTQRSSSWQIGNTVKIYGITATKWFMEKPCKLQRTKKL
jgi:hypothetical protein